MSHQHEEERVEFFVQEHHPRGLGAIMDIIRMDPERGIITDVMGTEKQARLWAYTYSLNNFPKRYNVERMDGSEIIPIARYRGGKEIS
jgi:hypothetical protein